VLFLKALIDAARYVEARQKTGNVVLTMQAEGTSR
jgi:hypothetical protein